MGSDYRPLFSIFQGHRGKFALVAAVEAPAFEETNLGRRSRVVDVVMHAANPDVEAALRRLLVGLERPVTLEEWKRPRESHRDRSSLPKAV